MREITIRLGLNEQLALTLPSGREVLLEWGKAEEHLRRLLREPRVPSAAPIPPPAVTEGHPIRRFTKTGRPIKIALTLEDLEL